MLEKLVNGFETHLFRNRMWVILSFILITIFLGYQASQLKMDAAFSKNIPLNHEYMKTYTKHQKDFGGANRIMVSVEDTSGNILTLNTSKHLKTFTINYFSSLELNVLKLNHFIRHQLALLKSLKTVLLAALSFQQTFVMMNTA